MLFCALSRDWNDTVSLDVNQRESLVYRNRVNNVTLKP